MDNHFDILAQMPDREKWLRKFEGEGGELVEVSADGWLLCDEGVGCGEGVS